MWDLALLQIVPGLHLAAPRDEPTLVEELREAVVVDDAPTVIRYPKGSVGTPVPAVERLADGVDVLARRGGEPGANGSRRDVLLVSVGAMSGLALDVADRLEAHGVSSTVIDPRWILPVPGSVIELAGRHRIVVVVEDGVRAGGIGSRIRQEMRAAGVDTALNEVGLPTEFLAHGSRSQVLDRVGLTAQRVAQDTLASVLGTRVPYARPVEAEEPVEAPGAPRLPDARRA
jgi:1-deoxy-D-xylulose-5-phosphate synthase